MFLFTTVLHVILCVILILVILLQPGKGSDIGAAFGGGGGGGSAVFGPRGAGSLLTQATTVAAVLFMFTSITLAIYSDQVAAGGGKIEDELLEEKLDEIDWGIPTEEAAGSTPAAPVVPSIVEEAAQDVLAPEGSEETPADEEGDATD